VQFQWRPRPPSLLTPEKEKEISENLEMYSKKYKQEDRDMLDEKFEHESYRRNQLREEWKRWIAKWKEQHDEERQCRMALRGGEDSDKEEEYQGKEVEVDEVVSVIEETLAFDLDQD
jgi:translation initiation factor 3 subunit B